MTNEKKGQERDPLMLAPEQYERFGSALVPAKTEEGEARHRIVKVAIWLESLRPNTAKQYGPEIGNFLRWLQAEVFQTEWDGESIPKALAEMIDATAVRRYVTWRVKYPKVYKRVYHRKDGTVNIATISYRKPVSLNRANGILSCLRSFANFLFSEKMIDEGQWGRIKLIKNYKTSAKPTRPVPKAVMQKTILAQKPEPDKPWQELRCLRDRAILMLMWTTGLRKSEVENLTVNDLYSVEEEGETKNYVAFVGKGDKPMEAPISETVLQQLNLWLSEVGTYNKPNEFLFVSLTRGSRPKRDYGGERRFKKLTTLGQVVRKCFVRAGYHDRLGESLYTPHGIRAGAASEIVLSDAKNGNSVDLDKVRKFLGHVSFQTSQRYVDAALETLKRQVIEELELVSPDVQDFEEVEEEEEWDF